MPHKISVIGAGSLFWSSALVRDLCLVEDMHGSTISLMDINKERLETIARFARRYASERKSDIKFEITLDRKESIKDSDVVLNVAMAGGHSYYEKMRRISEKYGYYRGINSVEWNMVSDYHTIWGYYQFKLAMEIARDVEALSPSAWFIQLSNPVFELTTLLGRETGLNVIGICHGHLDSREIVSALGLDDKAMEIESIGLNHTIWMTRFRKDNEDRYPLLLEWIDSKYADFLSEWAYISSTNPFMSQMSPAMVDMLKNFGLAPVGDTVRSGTWKYHRDLHTKKKWYGKMGGFDSRNGWNYYLRMENEIINGIREATGNLDVSLSSLYPPELSGEPVVPLLDALLNNKRIVHQVNVMNKGAIEGIPDDVAVEVPASVDGKGVRRMNGKSLPGRILNFSILPRIMRMEWSLEAYLEGGRQVLEMWLLSDPRTRNMNQVNEVLDVLLNMKGNEELARHFR